MEDPLADAVNAQRRLDAMKRLVADARRSRDRLFAAAIARGVTEREVAQACGLSRSFVHSVVGTPAQRRVNVKT